MRLITNAHNYLTISFVRDTRNLNLLSTHCCTTSWMRDEPSKPLDGIIRTLQQRKHPFSIYLDTSRIEHVELAYGNRSARKVQHGKLIIKRSKRNLAAVASSAAQGANSNDGRPMENPTKICVGV
jgi:hypothetical protein